jgi:hypothetical protein
VTLIAGSWMSDALGLGRAVGSRSCDTRSVFAVHATRKVLDRCGGVSSDVRPTSTALGDWYATALFWRPQVALFVNEATRLPVLVRLAPAATLVERFRDQLGSVLRLHGIDPRFVAGELGEMDAFRFAKTENRSVLAR